LKIDTFILLQIYPRYKEENPASVTVGRVFERLFTFRRELPED
jgi:hypothetical protein